MKILFYRTMSLLLIISLMVSTIPIAVFAADSGYVEVVKDNAPLRVKGDGDSKIAYRCKAGTVLKVGGSHFNMLKLSKWYRVEVQGSDTEELFIFDQNVRIHTHTPKTLDVNGIVYKVCTCGDISAETSTREQKTEAERIISSTALALPLAAADGPFPFGDLAVASVLILGVCFAHDYTIPDATELAEILKEADFVDYLEKREENICSSYSFRRVIRYPGGLKYVDKYCMDMVEAYVYVSLLHGDVYTADENSAMLLATMFGSGIMERDKPSRKKDVTTYFFHYHPGTNRTNKEHIFFGLNDLGLGPT